MSRGAKRSGTVGAHRTVALNVYLDLNTLAGLADNPGELAGYGTITAATGRALAASAESIRALITHPVPPDPAISTGTAAPPPHPAPPGHSSNPARGRACGTIIDAGRAVYRPPDPIDDHIRARDRRCQFPGCQTPAERCDIDHRMPYHDGGATCACNLDALCRTHHRLKTFTAWRAEPGPDGHLTWTSPTGHHYPTEPNHPTASPTPADTNLELPPF